MSKTRIHSTEGEIIETVTNDFQDELENLINKHSKENDSDTPDFLLAEFLRCVLDVFGSTMQKRDKFFSVRSVDDD